MVCKIFDFFYFWIISQKNINVLQPENNLQTKRVLLNKYISGYAQNIQFKIKNKNIHIRF